MLDIENSIIAKPECKAPLRMSQGSCNRSETSVEETSRPLRAAFLQKYFYYDDERFFCALVLPSKRD